LPGSGFFGIATSKKIGSHAVRNRAKRRWREAVRMEEPLLRPDLDYVAIVHEHGAKADFPEIRAELRALLERVNERWADE
jgi:ribonuclease P protein component